MPCTESALQDQSVLVAGANLVEETVEVHVESTTVAFLK